IARGYDQPTVNWVPEKYQPWVNASGGFKLSIENAYSRSVTQDLRPLVLTWPGALELLPRPPRRTDNSCIPVPDLKASSRADQALDYYTLPFWLDTPGAEP